MPLHAHFLSGSKVASRCKLDEFIADAAAWRVRTAANSRQRQLFDDVIGISASSSSNGKSYAKDAVGSKPHISQSQKVRNKGKDEIDELFDAASSDARPQGTASSKREALNRSGCDVPMPSSCDPSITAVLTALAAGSKKRKHK